HRKSILEGLDPVDGRGQGVPRVVLLYGLHDGPHFGRVVYEQVGGIYPAARVDGPYDRTPCLVVRVLRFQMAELILELDPRKEDECRDGGGNACQDDAAGS